MSTIYLSGPMTGHPNYNYSTFNRWADDLRTEGHKVFNPAEAFNGDQSLTWSEYMRHDIQQILQADEVRVLPQWQCSTGATLEVALAYGIGIPVRHLGGMDVFSNLGNAREAVDHTLMIHAQRALLQ